MSTDTQPETQDGNAVKTTPTGSGKRPKNLNGVATASRTAPEARRKGVRKANSGSSIPSSTKTRQKAIERSRSSSGTKILSPNPQKQRNSRLSSRMIRDSSIESTNSPTSDDGSLGSYSLGSYSNNSIVKSEITRTNGKVGVDLVSRTKNRESDEPLDKQKSRRAGLRRTGSRSSEITEQLDAQSPLSQQPSAYFKGRKKPPSESPIDESYRSTMSSNVRTAKGKRQSSSPKAGDAIGDASTHSETRRTRRSKNGGSSGSSSKQRSSSGKSVRNSDMNNRHSRRSRTPSSKKGTTPSNSESSVDRDKNKVTEEEIMDLLDSTNHDRKGSKDDDMQQKTIRSKRKSKSPARDTFDANYLEKKSPGKHRVQQRLRSNSSGAIESTKPPRRYSNEGGKVAKEKRTRTPPRRSRSNNIGVDSGLGSFLKQGSEGSRRKKASSRSVLSGSKSVTMSGSKTVYSTYSTNSAGRPRRRHLKSGKSLKSDPSPRRSHRYDRKFYDDENGTIMESDYDDSDDNSVEVDLDLATARNNFVQQNLNEELTAKLSKTDELLYSVFPKHIADALRNGQKVAPENHDLVTIFFSDIVGFTDISAKLDPLKISDMLDRLYNSFDALSDYHDVFKVET